MDRTNIGPPPHPSPSPVWPKKTARTRRYTAKKKEANSPQVLKMKISKKTIAQIYVYIYIY